jgi:hypothetical protein
LVDDNGNEEWEKDKEMKKKKINEEDECNCINKPIRDGESPSEILQENSIVFIQQLNHKAN